MRPPHAVRSAGRAAVPVVVFAAICLSAGEAWCQDAPQTRAELLRRARQAQSITPYQPTGLERAMDVAENRVQPLLARAGLHWKLGSLSTGKVTPTERWV